MKYDFLIIGAGIAGSTCANLLTKKGKTCLVIDKESHIGGHCRTEKQKGIDVHVYGPHIFNTSHEDVWKYVQEFSEFNNYIHKVISNYNNIYYSMPINLMTFQQLWGTVDLELIELKKKKHNILDPKNFKEYILSQLGEEIYTKLFEGYTKKQWHKDPSQVPIEVAKRVPIRHTFDDRYFFSKYQGIPKNGYSEMISNMLNGIEVLLEVDYFKQRHKWDKIALNTIYTGKIDQFFNYEYGKLDYLSLKFEHEIIDKSQYQGNSVINFTEEKIPYTRIIEHKHFNPIESDQTIITKEYSEGWNTGRPYYPLNNEINNKLLKKYKFAADKLRRTHITGRLGDYKYYDMDDSIKAAMNLVEKII